MLGCVYYHTDGSREVSGVVPVIVGTEKGCFVGGCSVHEPWASGCTTQVCCLSTRVYARCSNAIDRLGDIRGITSHSLHAKNKDPALLEQIATEGGI
jgi:hypothetical protein